MQDHHTTHRRLVDILAGGTDQIRKQWNETEAAADFAPLPAGMYECHVQSIELFNSRTNHTPGVKLTFCVADGEHAGRYVFHDLWLTPAALPQTKRDCNKLGIISIDQLENGASPPGRIRCRVRIALRRDDDGTEYNRVRGFNVIGIDEPKADPFAPADGQLGEASPEVNAGMPDADVSFKFGANIEGNGAVGSAEG